MNNCHVFKAPDNYLEEWMENAFSYDALKSLNV